MPVDTGKTNVQSIHSLLSHKEDNKLGKLLTHIEYLRTLENQLLDYLGPPLNKHCSLANHSDDTIILHTDSPTWAAKLRYNIPAILVFMQKNCQLKSLKKIHIKIIPPTYKIETSKIRRVTISAESADIVASVADTIFDNKLRSSLLKLSKHGHKK